MVLLVSMVSIYGGGQLGTAVAELLRASGRHDVGGPFGRSERDRALAGGADVVVIATTTRLADVAADIETAVRAGSNVLVSAEEAAYPWIVDRHIAERLDRLARERGVSVVGGGVNPGLLFDALVLTMLGAAPDDCTVHVRRVVDISRFGPAVLARIGVGAPSAAFVDMVRRGEILGHAGFPQSMHVVAAALGLQIDAVDGRIEPLVAARDVVVGGRLLARAGTAAGVEQIYVAEVAGRRWFTAEFLGHVHPESIGQERRDVITLLRNGQPWQRTSIEPGVDAQTGSRHMIANSVDRLITARPGWVTLADLPPARPVAPRTPLGTEPQ